MSVCQDWIGPNELVGCGCPDASEAQILEAISVASDMLFNFSGRQYPGLCAETVRPCSCGSCGPMEWFGGWSGPMPYLSGGVWRNSCGCRGGYCGCSGNAIRLPRARIESVDQVLIDGALFMDYRLDKPGWLVRTDGGSWPCCQAIEADTSEAGTWAVTYTHGRVPPVGGVWSAKQLTTEIVKACVGEDCALPAHAVAVVRRGVSYNIEALNGKVGLQAVDQWISSVNPQGRMRRARITSPDDDRFVPVESGS